MPFGENLMYLGGNADL